ncbi:SDR family oxidoreductase [Paracoccus cavernae]|uniref:SDR family oxidoreductase n=1 Tax=Paracoccus cavernae TaxID=1571207 RepID=A0ABT8DA52_9RHOB|nr:SDR family oxidoreductase [Paracoccus cavernae]
MGADGFCRRHVARGRALGRRGQQPAARHPCHRPCRKSGRRCLQGRGISIEEARKRREATIPTRSYGTAEDFGATCAFMCSQHARFMVGQNILLDGGASNISI